MNKETRYLLDYILENGYVDSLDQQELEMVVEEYEHEEVKKNLKPRTERVKVGSPSEYGILLR